jgi:hypothetical protein
MDGKRRRLVGGCCRRLCNRRQGACLAQQRYKKCAQPWEPFYLLSNKMRLSEDSTITGKQQKKMNLDLESQELEQRHQQKFKLLERSMVDATQRLIPLLVPTTWRSEKRDHHGLYVNDVPPRSRMESNLCSWRIFCPPTTPGCVAPPNGKAPISIAQRRDLVCFFSFSA